MVHQLIEAACTMNRASWQGRPHFNGVLNVALPQLFDVLWHAVTRGVVDEVFTQLRLHLEVAQLIG